MEEQKLNYVDIYYREFVPQKREKILEQLLAENDSEENQIRKELFEKRYGEKSQRRDQDRADGFVKLWMNMKFSAENVTGWFGVRGMKKEITKQMSVLGIPQFMSRGELVQEMLYREYYHLTALYIDISMKDKNYTSAFMGMMPIKEENVYRKIAADVFKVAYDVPRRVDMEDELEMLSKAATEAFRNILPDSWEYLEELIDRSKEA